MKDLVMTFSGSATTAYADDVPVALGEAGRIAQLLNLPRSNMVTELDIDETITKGLPLKAYDTLVNAVRGENSDWQPAIVSVATLQRAKKNKTRLKPEASDKLYEFARIVDSARMVFRDDRDGIQQFFLTPNALLKDRRPFDVAMSSRAGGDAVLRILNEARAGVAL
jgi:putative toxin-antitoxin system antitoxin component (TIGR02293 family)